MRGARDPVRPNIERLLADFLPDNTVGQTPEHEIGLDLDRCASLMHGQSLAKRAGPTERRIQSNQGRRRTRDPITDSAGNALGRALQRVPQPGLVAIEMANGQAHVSILHRAINPDDGCVQFRFRLLFLIVPTVSRIAHPQGEAPVGNSLSSACQRRRSKAST
jgi:hypothetical protein